MRALFSFIIALLIGAGLLAYFALFVVNQNEQALVLDPYGALHPGSLTRKPGARRARV